MGNLAVNEENQNKAGRIGVVEAIVDAMNQHPRHQGVQERGCSALRNICGSFDNQAKVAAAGGIQAVRRMTPPGKRSARQALASPFARFLTVISCVLMVQVTAALRNHVSHTGTCERGCAALGNLTFKNPENQALAAQHNSIEAVASAMRSHISASSVQERGAAALGALPRGRRRAGRGARFRSHLNTEIAEKHAAPCSRLADASRSDRRAPRETPLSLATATAGNMGFRNPSNQKRVAQCGGVELIVDAIGKFGEHRGVQEQGFRALRNLAVLDEATLEKAVEAAEEPEEAGGLGALQPPKMPTNLAGVPAALKAYVVRGKGAGPRPFVASCMLRSASVLSRACLREESVSFSFLRRCGVAARSAECPSGALRVLCETRRNT